ncbi:unnamed protein product [Fusarium graminearum]|nr:unnamed protein product [Fusarium graminearum]
MDTIERYLLRWDGTIDDINQVNNFIDEAIAEALTSDVTAPAFTEAASTTTLAFPTLDDFALLGSGNEKRQADAATGLLGLKPGQMNKRQLEAITGLLGPLLGGGVTGLTPHN